jgi:hypothetical protein
MSTASKKHPGQKNHAVGFTHPLLAVFCPAYEIALRDWQKETGRTLSEHFTAYKSGRANEVMRAVRAPAALVSNEGFLKSFAEEPDFMAFVFRRFHRLIETGDATGKPGTVNATGVFKLLKSQYPSLSNIELAELAQTTEWAKKSAQLMSQPNGKPNNILAAQAIKPLCDANKARLAEIEAANAAADARREAAEAALSAADKRRLATYRRKLDALFIKHRNAETTHLLKEEGGALNAQYQDLLDRIS